MTGRYWPNCPKLLDALKEKLLSDPSIPMDFFSFHNYAYEPEDVAENAEVARKFLVDTGHEDAIIVMDEYNYVPDWSGADLYDLLLTQRAAAETGTAILIHQPGLDHENQR